jgi:phosphoesterase RecJ-like protein
MKDIKTAIRDELDGASRVLLMGHRDPDGDSAGSLLAMAQAIKGKQVYCYSQGRLSERYRFLDPEGRLKHDIDTEFRPDLAIAFECPVRARLGDGLKMLAPTTRLVNIDHHPDNDKYGDVNWVDTHVAALGEMIYALFVEWGQKITRHMAACLYAAILTDTGRFHFSGTSARTLDICSELVKLGADPKAITESVYFGLPFSYLRLMQAALNRMERSADGRIVAFTLLPEDFTRAGADPSETEGIIELTLVPSETRIGVLFRQPAPGSVKISFRSQDSIDVGKLAAEFHGGGHKHASGCVISGQLDEVKTKVLKRAAELLGATP